MPKPDYFIRTMTRGEIDLALDWAAAEGWNPGLHDAESFHAADPNGFLIGLLAGEPVAAISVVRYGATFGFLGLYLVKQEHRGQGYGLAIWKAGMAYLAGRNVGLDGVVAQQPNYKKSGFTWAYANARYQGQGGGAARDESGIIPLAELPFKEVCAYDRQFFPEDRERFLRSWVRQPQSAALAVRENDRLAGYGVLRVCRSGYKIGPLFADRADLAERLFIGLKSRATAGAPFFLDVPVVNSAAVDLAKRHGMNAVFETARMYTGDPPATPLERVFGVTTFELG